MKRDLRLNMGQLAETQQNILDYKARLQALEAACVAFKSILDRQESVSFNVLSDEMEKGIIRNIQEMEMRMDTLQSMLSGYMADMKGYVAPQIESQMMRVDRDDIWFNIKQIQSTVEEAQHGLAYPVESPADYRNVYIDWNSDGAEYLQNEINAESYRRQSNYNKLVGFRNASTGAGYQQFADTLNAIWLIYNNNIKEFENTDDAYAGRANQCYDEWRTLRSGRQELGSGRQDAGRGIRDVFSDTVDSLFSLAAVLLSRDFFQDVTGLEVSDSINDRVQRMGDSASMILKNVKEAFGMMNNGMSDVYAEEGMGYAIDAASSKYVMQIVAARGVSPVVRETASTEVGMDGLMHRIGSVGMNIGNALAEGARQLLLNNEVVNAEKDEPVVEIERNIDYEPHDLKVDWPGPGDEIEISRGTDVKPPKEMATVSEWNAWSIEYSIEGCRTGKKTSGELCDIRLQYAIHTYTDNNKDDDDLLIFYLKDKCDGPVYAGAMVEGYADIGDIVRVKLDDGTSFNFLILDTKNTEHTYDELKAKDGELYDQCQWEYGHGYMVGEHTVQLQICEFITAGNYNIDSAKDAESGAFLLKHRVVETEIINHVDIDDNYVIVEE